MAKRPTTTAGKESSRRSRPASFEDAQIVERILDGHPEAYGALVTKYQDRVFNTCWRICGHLEDARDLTQDAFLKAFEGLPSFRRQSSFYTWLFRVAVNLALSRRRQARTRQAVSLDQPGPAGSNQAEALGKRLRDAEARTPAQSASESELQAKVVEALQALDDDYRAVIVLRDIEGLDYREIAEVLSLATGTVKSRLHRARMALREAVAPLIARES